MIRPAAPADLDSLLACIQGLARYEKLEHELELDAGRLRAALFGPDACAFALVAEEGADVVGFALGFVAFSTFKTKVCLHLEDLFVREDRRGRGHGLALLRAVAKEAVRRGCARLGWNVLDWNAPAIAFYERQGARLLSDWRSCRLDGDALHEMAALAE
jgi:GNAT superfamily N-acetyltransferase